MELRIWDELLMAILHCKVVVLQHIHLIFIVDVLGLHLERVDAGEGLGRFLALLAAAQANKE